MRKDVKSLMAVILFCVASLSASAQVMKSADLEKICEGTLWG